MKFFLDYRFLLPISLQIGFHILAVLFSIILLHLHLKTTAEHTQLCTFLFKTDCLESTVDLL